MKKRVFIGSSSEAKDVVDEIERLLNSEYEVFRWDISFSLNKSTLDNLICNAAKTDVAIFVGTADDIVIPENEERRNREGEKIKNRDNVVFEFGLFLGMLGRADCVYMTDKESDVMSDMDGITRVIFDRQNYKEDLPRAIKIILGHFNTTTNKEVSLFPSVSLASSYFVNFIKPLWMHYLHNGNKLQTKKQNQYDNCEIVVVIPERITGNIDANKQLLFSNKGVEKLEIDCIGRLRNIDVIYNKEENVLKIYDMPTVLSSLEHSIKNILPEGDLDYSRILAREKDRFIEALLEFAKKEHNIMKISIISETTFEQEVVAHPKKNGFAAKIAFLGNKHSY